MNQIYHEITRMHSHLPKSIAKIRKIKINFFCLIGLLFLNSTSAWAATFTVVNISDAGPGSLRQAILDANNDATLDIIEFNIGTGLQTIQLLAALPLIDKDLIIDGTSQTGFLDNPIIELDGSLQGVGSIIRFDGVATGVIKGLILNGGPASGVFFENCSSGSVDNCFIGTDSTGAGIDGNAIDGVSISNSTGVIIQNSVLSGNSENGVLITNNSTTNIVRGCKIGTDLSGSIDIGNSNRGVFLDGSGNNTIGGDALADRNIISGNTRHGVSITGNGNTVKGNFIGVDATGNIALGNDLDGIIIQANNSIIGTSMTGNVISSNGARGVTLGLTSTGNMLQNNIIGLNANGDMALGNNTGVNSNINTTNNTIGGQGLNEGNTISGNEFSGLFLKGTGQKVEGNRIGTDITGDIALGNGASGVRIDECDNCTVGGLNIGAGNIISGNDNSGVLIENGSTGTDIDGNFVGTNATADAALPNAFSGIRIDGSDNNNVGVNAGNVISGNTGSGVHIINNSTGNVLIGNLIGSDVLGLDAIPNEFGISISSGSQNNFIGGAGGFEGNLISGNLLSGITVADNSNGTSILANIIGANLNATNALPNGAAGIVIDDSKNCLIGNGTEDGQNLISGNMSDGIFIQNGSEENEVLQNCIGTDIAGTGDLGNSGAGITILDSGSNIIGSPTGRNIISGNGESGVRMDNPNSQDNIIQNNIIGLDINGLSAIPNDGFGIVILANSGGNHIGGLNLNEGNIVSANLFSGIASGADNQTIEGNKVGTNINGVNDLGNNNNGIFLNGASNCVVDNNLISGNEFSGVFIDDDAFGNQLLGNKIGTNEGGNDEIENSQQGILLSDTDNNIIGGAGIGESNLISGNAVAGIGLINGSDGNKILGNKIGTDILGANSIPNNDAIFVGSDSNNTEIGGPNAGEGNLLSGNTFDGIDINSNSIGTIIRGNIIGLNENGMIALPNGDIGIEIEDSPNTVIGGSTENERNIISGNENIGIEILNNAADGAIIIGNFIGTNKDGNSAIGNNVGIEIEADDVVIGGSAMGQGNVISGNEDDGITYFGDNGIIQGNKIGTDANGTFALPNADSGVDASGDNVLIGGSAVGEGNLVSGNEGIGIESSGDDAVIKGNIVGMDVDGMSPLPNEDSGMSIEGDNLQIGGQGPNEGNLISANEENGIDLFDGDNVVIQGNIIGLNINGSAAAGNFGDGINDGSQGLVTIGGSSSAAKNIISANGLNGISSVFAVDGEILGNLIGTDISGTLDFGNGAEGIAFFACLNYVVGGDALGSPNIIAFNAIDGVGLSDDQFFFSGFECEEILISENSIFNNGDKGINYLGNQSQVAIPDLTNVTSGANPSVQGTLNGNPNTDYTIEFFKNFNANASGNHEGEIFIGNDIITTDGAGNGIISTTLNEMINPNEIITATARADNQNTSEFSLGVVAGALPIELVSILATPFEDHILLRWVTESEVNNTGFHIERFSNENAWETIAFVNGSGTKSSQSRYTFQDNHIIKNRTYYYRLRQEDYDGRYEYTKIVNAEISGRFSIGDVYPNPVGSLAYIDVNFEGSENAKLDIIDAVGRRITTKVIDLQDNELLTLRLDDLRSGKYTVRIAIENQVFVRSLIKK